MICSSGIALEYAELQKLGRASSIIDRSELSEEGRRPLESTVRAGAVDCVGGVTLAEVLS